MNTTLRYCPKCFNQLREWGQPAMSVYEHICEYYATQDGSVTVPEDYYITIGDNFLQIAYFLEEKGYVISTESLDDIHIQIKPSHCEFDGLAWYFCADRKHPIFM